MDISQGHIEAKTIDANAIYVSSLFDISQGRIKAQTIDASAIYVTTLLDISQGRIKANTIDASAISVTSLLDISQGRINAKTIDASAINVSSLLDISQGRIKSKTIDTSAITVSSLLDISRGTILANTISGSAITINANALNSSNIINITINNTNIRGINISTRTTNLNSNAITINNVRVATIQHIKNAIPDRLIVAYNSTTIPYGWALCDGSNNTPDLRGRFILNTGLTGRVFNSSGGLENVILNTDHLPQHRHTFSITYIPTREGDQKSSGGVEALDWGNFTQSSTVETGYTGGDNISHNNMPPYYVLIYIMKTTNYDYIGGY